MERILQSRYRIIRVLGRGGRGVVYLCEDLRLPSRQWAVKQMQRPEPGTEEKFREIFVREAATLSRLRHPNLPAVADFFEEDAEWYLVMEFVDGENLAEHVRRCGAFTEEKALGLGSTLCGVLEYLHGCEPPIVFRDLKPENVMVTDKGDIKLIDFGLARSLEPDARSDTLPSGSVGYAAPEQWDEHAQLDGRADIYSWGATILYLLTGHNPPPQMPLAVLRHLKRPLSDGARAILERCLDSHPTGRYRGATVLADDVRYVLSAEQGPSLADPPDTSRASRGATAGRRILTSLAVLLLATLALVAMLATKAPPPEVPSAQPPTTSPPLDAVGVDPYRPRGTASEKMVEARRLYAERKWKDVADRLDEVIAQYPEDGEAHILRENARLRLSAVPCLTLPFVSSITGVDATDSISDVQGIALAQATVNARGGIRGRKVIVDCYDDESSTSRCLEIAQRLVQNPDTTLVLGPLNSQRALAIAPLFNAAHVNLIAPTVSSRLVWEAGPYIFTASESRRPRIRALARHAVRTGHLRVAGIGEGTSRLSHEMVEIFETELRASGGTFIPMPRFKEGQQDFREQVDAVAESKPDMIFFADYRGVPLGLFATQLRERGLQTPICAQTTSMERHLVDVGGENVNGVILSESFHPRIDAPLTRAFVAAFNHKFGDVTATYPAAENFDAFNAVVEGLQTASTREELNAFFRASGVTRPAFNGVSGRFALGRCMDARPVWLIEVIHGRFRLLSGAEQEAAQHGVSR